MIKSYIVELESRIEALNQLVGNQAQYQQQSKACRQKLEELQIKISANKDTQRKYQKLATYVEKYNDTLDGVCSKDKVNIIVDELDNLNQIVELMNRIEKNLPCLNADEFKGTGNKFIHSLATESTVRFNEESSKLEIIKYRDTELESVGEQERKQMNAIMQLNYRMINNLNERLKLAYGSRIKNGKKI